MSSSFSRSNSSQNITEELQCNSKIETLFLQAAFKTAKEGGIQELLDQSEDAQSNYLFSAFLLKALVTPTDLAPITSKFAQIQIDNLENLNRYIDIIQERLK